MKLLNTMEKFRFSDYLKYTLQIPNYNYIGLSDKIFSYLGNSIDKYIEEKVEEELEDSDYKSEIIELEDKIDDLKKIIEKQKEIINDNCLWSYDLVITDE